MAICKRLFGRLRCFAMFTLLFVILAVCDVFFQWWTFCFCIRTSGFCLKCSKAVFNHSHKITIVIILTMFCCFWYLTKISWLFVVAVGYELIRNSHWWIFFVLVLLSLALLFLSLSCRALYLVRTGGVDVAEPCFDMQYGKKVLRRMELLASQKVRGLWTRFPKQVATHFAICTKIQLKRTFQRFIVAAHPKARCFSVLDYP